MKDYYYLLGIAKFSDGHEIKKAYRKLAVMYHPDKNPDPKAHEYFAEVTEAYNVLSDPKKKSDYDLQLANPFFETATLKPEPKHRDPAYKKQRPNPGYKSQKQRLFEMMTAYLPMMHKLLYAAAVFIAVFLIDTLLTSSTETVSVIEIRHSSNARNYFAYLSTGDSYKIRSDDAMMIALDTPMQFEKSTLLRIPLSLTNTVGQTFRFPVTLRGNFIFLPLSLLVVTLAGFAFRKRTETSFNCSVFAAVFLIFNLVFLFLI